MDKNKMGSQHRERKRGFQQRRNGPGNRSPVGASSPLEALHASRRQADDADKPAVSIDAFPERWKTAATELREVDPALADYLDAEADAMEAGLEEFLRTREDMSAPPAPSWRERIWTVPAEMRLDVNEATEAIGRSRSWFYASKNARTIPFRRGPGGQPVFVAGELRDWIKQAGCRPHGGVR